MKRNFSFQAVFMVDWCPYNAEALQAAKCTRDPEIADFNYTYLLDVPVISSNSGVIYQNVFCGTCHKEYYFTQFNYDFFCDCELTSSQLITELPYQEDNLTWTGPRPTDVACMNAPNITCKMTIGYPPDIGHSCEENLIDTCPTGNLGPYYKSLNDGCIHGNNYYVQDKHSNVYKNVNCSSCNGVSLIDVICLSPRPSAGTVSLPGGNLWQLSDLFTVDHSTCASNQVYDPVFGTCEDFYVNPETGEVVTPNVTGSNNTQIPTHPGKAISIFSTVMMSISIICLLLHMIIFLILFKDRNLHSKNLFSMCLALFLAETFFIFSAEFCDSYLSCYILTVIVYYCFLSAFFWMNVISFDICKTFQSRHVRSQSNRIFLRYWFYAWGFPILMAVCAVLIDLLAPTSSVAPGFLKGDAYFWFGNLGGLIMFFVAPVEIIFLVNMLMFILSLDGIFKQKKSGKMASATAKKNKKKMDKVDSTASSHSNTISKEEEKKIHQLITGKLKKTLREHEKDVRNFKLFWCLAVLMGMPWIFAILTPFSIVFEYIFNILNSMQGIFIFLAFDCKRKVFNNVIACCTGREIQSSYYSTPKTTNTTNSRSSTRTTDATPSNKRSVVYKTSSQSTSEIKSESDSEQIPLTKTEEHSSVSEKPSSYFDTSRSDSSSPPPYNTNTIHFQSPPDIGNLAAPIEQEALQESAPRVNIVKPMQKEESPIYESVGYVGKREQDHYQPQATKMSQYPESHQPSRTFNDNPYPENFSPYVEVKNPPFGMVQHQPSSALEAELQMRPDFHPNHYPQYEEEEPFDSVPIYDVPQKHPRRVAGRHGSRNYSLRKALSDSDDIVDV